ncbi:MAG: hypothetical protein WA825_11975 [Steroidobacteraceae bacterium]
MSPALKILFAALMLIGATASAGPPTPAPPEVTGPPDATFTISGGVIALGIGYQWARGTLVYQGHSIPFAVRGVSLLDIGAARIAGSGEVFHLQSLDDFAGRYAGTTFGSAFARGASLGLIKNEHGVIIRARSTVSGVRLNFSGNAMRIRLGSPAAHLPGA